MIPHPFKNVVWKGLSWKERKRIVTYFLKRDVTYRAIAAEFQISKNTVAEIANTRSDPNDKERSNRHQPERNKLVLDYRLQYKSATEIVKLMADLGYSLSRGAVLGIIHRHGSEEHKKPTTFKAKPRGKKRRDPIVELKPKIVALPVQVVKLDPLGPLNQFPPSGCCTHTDDIVGSGQPWRMCGRPGYPYCESHAIGKRQQKRTSPQPRQREWNMGLQV